MANEKQILKAPGIITKITTMEDRALRLQLDCQEMTTEDEAQLLGLRDKIGWFVFSPEKSHITDDDLKLPEIQVDKNEKTPGQRLRGVIYRLWEQGGKKGDSEEHYRIYMNKLIEKIKEQLN